MNKTVVWFDFSGLLAVLCRYSKVNVVNNSVVFGISDTIRCQSIQLVQVSRCRYSADLKACVIRKHIRVVDGCNDIYVGIGIGIGGDCIGWLLRLCFRFRFRFFFGEGFRHSLGRSLARHFCLGRGFRFGSCLGLHYGFCACCMIRLGLFHVCRRLRLSRLSRLLRLDLVHRHADNRVVRLDAFDDILVFIMRITRILCIVDLDGRDGIPGLRNDLEDDLSVPGGTLLVRHVLVVDIDLRAFRNYKRNRILADFLR